MLPFLSVIVGAQFVDRALAVKAMGWQPAVFSASMLVAISFLQALGNNLYSFFRVIQRGRVYPVIEKSMTEKIACLPYSYIENDKVQDLLSRVAAEPEAVLSGILEKNLELWGLIATNISLFAVLMAYAPVWISLIVAGMLALFGRFAVKGGKKQYEAHAEVTFHRRRASYYEEIMGNRAMANERMLFRYAGEINNRFLEESRKARAKERKARFWWFLWSNAGGYAAIGISIIVIVVLLGPVVRGDTSIGIFISLVTAFMSMTQVITWQFPDIVKELAKGGQALKEFGTVMDMPVYTDAEEKSFTGLTENLSFESLEFRGVSFRYPDTETDVLKDMSFRIERGRHYAFAGRNGCGKSTVWFGQTGGPYSGYGEGENRGGMAVMRNCWQSAEFIRRCGRPRPVIISEYYVCFRKCAPILSLWKCQENRRAAPCTSASIVYRLLDLHYRSAHSSEKENRVFCFRISSSHTSGQKALHQLFCRL